MPHHANQTSFKPGADARRHQFTAAERRKGYRNAQRSCGSRPGIEGWDLAAWLFRRIRSYYRARRRESA